MCPLQDRTKPDSDSELNDEDSSFEVPVGWDSYIELDQYLKNKNITTRLIHLANKRLPLSSIIFTKGIQFEVNHLKTTGWTHQAKCPFPNHKDSNPSFGYNSKEERFSCFGCQHHGRSVEFLAFLENRSFLDVAKHILTSRCETEEVIVELDQQINARTNSLLRPFAVYCRQFLLKHSNNPIAIECFKKVAESRDMYLAKHVMRGTLDDEELEAVLVELKQYLDSFGV